MAFFSFGQEATDLLKKSKAACQSITNGYYETSSRKKWMSGPDTSAYASTCYFKRHTEELPFPISFHSSYRYNGEYGRDALFTGKELVTFSTKDSTGTITNLETWKEHIESIAHNYDFYDPFTSSDSSPLPEDSTFLDSTYRVTLHGVEKVGEHSCYHIETHERPDDEGSPFKVLDIELHFWINIEDMIPVQYSATISLVMAQDTMVQYDLITVTRYALNTPFDPEKISLNVIPSYCSLKEFSPYPSPVPLPVDTVAPGWSFPSLSDEMVSLKSLKGKVVLIDFFYKACMPCMQALPALQSLHEKYKDKGLVVIGLDPYDDKEDNLPAFLAKRNVDYPVLYASKEIAKTYRVSGYPTMFLVSKDGNIIHVQEGYGDSVEAKLEALILKNL